MDSSEFLIRILVRARNEISGVMQKAAADVDKLTNAQERNQQRTKKLANDVEDARRRFAGFNTEIEKSDKDLKATAQTFRSFSSEFDRLASRAKPGSDLAQSLRDQAAAARRAAAVAIDAERQRTAVVQQESAKRVQATRSEVREAEQAGERAAAAARKSAVETERARGAERLAHLKSIQDQRQLRTEIEDTVARFELFNTEVDRGAHSSTRAASGYRQFSREFSTLQSKFRAGSDDALSLGERFEESRQRASLFGGELRRSGVSADHLHNSLLRLFGVDDSKLERINNRLNEFASTAGKSRFAVAAIDNRLRGLLTVGIIAFFQQLVGAALALAGTLASVASAAVQAGAALAGMAVAGAAQALPVVGLLAAAWGRVGAVFKAVQQAQKAQTQATYDNAQAADRSRSAARAVEQAQKGVADAHRRVTDSQQSLNKARQDGVRQIEDLIAAERQAQLQAEQAAQAQIDAQHALRQAVRTGDIDAQAAAELNLQQSNLGVDQAATGLTRARQDAGRARRGGIEGLDSVVAAKRALEDAKRGIDDANQSLKDAQQSASETVKQQATGQRLLAQMLAQLSPAERRLFEISRTVQATYKKFWQNGVLQPIIDSFALGAARVNALLTDPRILGAATSLADAIAGQVNRITKFLSSDRVVSFFVLMSREAKRNLPIVVGLLKSLADIAMNVATAAAPALHDFLTFLKGLAGAADDATSGGGLDRLQEFFSNGEKYAEGFIQLGLAILQLFGAIIGASAKQGSDAIASATKSINQATAWVNSHRRDIAHFISQAREGTGIILEGLGKIAVALFSLFHPEQIKVFVRAFEAFVLPALQDVFNILGAVTQLILTIFASGPGSGFARFVLTIVLLQKTLGPMITLFARLIVAFGTFISAERLVAGGLFAIEVASGPIGVLLAGIAAVVFLLRDRFHDLGSALTTVAEILGGVAVGGLLFKFLGLGKVFGGIVSSVGSLISKLPLLNRLLKTTATTQAAEDVVAGFSGAPVGGVAKEATTLASRFGGTFLTVAKGLIKKAGWVGLGLSAAEGIISGFKHHSVAAGFQDFFHTITFGLIQSVDEAGKQAGEKLSNRLRGSMDNLFRGGRNPGILHNLTAAINDITTFRQGGNQAEGRLAPLTRAQQQIAEQITKLHDKYGPEFDSFIGGLRDSLRDFHDALKQRDPLGVETAFNSLSALRKDAPKELAGTLDDMIQTAKEKRDELIGVFDRRAMVTAIVGNFGLALQAPKADIAKLTKGLVDEMKNLPPDLQKKARDGAVAMARGLAERGVLSKNAADDIKKSVVNSYKELHKQSTKQAIRTASDTATALSAVANVIAVSMGGIVSDVNSVLKELGFGQIRIPKHITSQDVNKGAKGAGAAVQGIVGTLGGLFGQAGGGWVGQQGARGGDSPAYARWLAPGEAVLNWAHQMFVEPAMRAYHGFGLDEMFKKVRGQQGSPAGDGMVAGGREAGGRGIRWFGHPTNINAQLTRLLGRIERLFPGAVLTSTTDHSRLTTSGNVSDHVGGNAMDVSGSIGTMNAIARWILGSGIQHRAKQLIYSGGHPTLAWNRGQNVGAGFFGPAVWAQHANHIHIAIVGALGKLLDAAGSQIGKVNAPGRGPLSLLVEGTLNRVVKAANRRIGRAFSNEGTDLHFGDVGRGGNFEQNRALARRMLAAVGGLGGTFPMLDYIISNESHYDPTISYGGGHGNVNVAYGIPQALPGTKMASAGADWRTNPRTQLKWMFGYIRSAYGTLTNAYNHWRANHSYDAGGEIPGPQGMGVPILAHAREWIVNPIQQGILAHLAGMSIPALRGHLGFHGGRGSYAGGGEPFSERDVNQTPNALLREARRARQIISDLSNPASGRSNFARSIRELFGDGGLFDQLSEAITTLTTRLETSLNLAIFKVKKSGNVVRRLGPVGVADRTLANLERTYDALVGERGALQGQLKDITSRLKDAKGKQAAYLKGYARAIRKRLDDVNGQVADNLQSTFDAVEQTIQTRVDRATSRADRANAAVDLLQRGRALAGGTLLSAFGAPSNAQVSQFRAGVLGRQAGAITRAAHRARAAGHHDTARALLQQAAELRMQAQEALAQGISDDFAEVGRQFDRRNNVLDLRSQIAQALGRTSDIQKIAVERIRSTNDQINALLRQQAAAKAGGFFDLAEQIGDQISQLQNSVTQAVIQQLHDAVDAVDAAAQRRGAQLDLQDRMASVLEAAGNHVGAFALRGRTLAGRGTNIQDQISALSPLLTQAQNAGDVGLTNQLKDELADLRVQLFENASAIRENTTAARQSRIDAITGRGSFLTGVFGGLGGLVQAVASVTGALDINAQRQLVQQTIATLQSTGGGLAQQLFEAFGIDVRGATPARLVQILSHLNFDGIEANFSDSQRQQFEALIGAVIDNATAVQTNTQQLETLTDPTSQAWSTTAWQWFRNAIFNGAGGLLPQYQVPSLDTGGHIITSGMIYAHSGEGVVAANVARGGQQQSDVFAPTINVEERVVDMDPETLANRLYFRYKDRPRS